ncbi:hypothetical protein FIG89_02630 [Salmonella enterica subsp. enterica]|nr:hypothetical protein [Salmonella enterica subsp. enterica serovar Potsdam]
MYDDHITSIPDILLNAMMHADSAVARRLFDDAGYCGRALSVALVTTGRLLEEISEQSDLSHEEVQAMGRGIVATADLVAGMFALVETYRYRQLRGELPVEEELTHGR